jgi:hypothetical protein
MNMIEIPADVPPVPTVYFDPWCENPVLCNGDESIRLTKKQWLFLAKEILENISTED